MRFAMTNKVESNGKYQNGMHRSRRKSVRRRLLTAFIVLILIPTAAISFVSIYLFQQISVNAAEPTTAVEVIKITSTVFFLLTLFFAIKLTQRIASPVERLGKTAEQIASGNFHLAAEIEHEDDIGNLARSINKLTAQHLNLTKKFDSFVSEKTAENARYSLQLKTAAEVSRDACQLFDTAELMDTTVSLIYDRFGGCFAGIFIVDENQEYAELKAAAGKGAKDLLTLAHRIELNQDGAVAGVVNTGLLKLTHDIQTEKEDRKYPLLADTRSEVILPIKAGEKVLGALDIQGSDENQFDSNTIISLQILADQIAMALEIVNILNQREMIINQIQSGYGDYTLRSWQDYLKRSAKSVGYRWRGEGPEPAGELDQVSQAALRAEMVVKNSSQSGEQPVDQETNTTIAIPMKIRGQMIGVTNIQLKEGETTPETTALFVEIVNRLALTLENTRLLEEAQLRGEQLHLLQEITSAAAAHINLHELLEAVCRRILEGFRLSRCGCLLLNDDRSEAFLAVDEHLEVPAKIMRGTKIPIYGNETFQEYIYLQRSGICEDVQTNPSAELMQEFFTLRGTQKLLVLPLTSRGETVGLILMETDDTQRQFSEDDLRLADQIGLQVSTAIDVAHLFEQTERRAEKEKLISDTTTKIRETLDIETVLKTAAREMRRALNLAEVEIRLGTGGISGYNGDSGMEND
jgi:GAF domain-containing protein/HAMP domain-containing protein